MNYLRPRRDWTIENSSEGDQRNQIACEFVKKVLKDDWIPDPKNEEEKATFKAKHEMWTKGDIKLVSIIAYSNFNT